MSCLRGDSRKDVPDLVVWQALRPILTCVSTDDRRFPCGRFSFRKTQACVNVVRMVTRRNGALPADRGRWIGLPRSYCSTQATFVVTTPSTSIDKSS